MNALKYRIFLLILIFTALFVAGILYYNSIHERNNYSEGTLVRNTIEKCVKA